MLTNTIYNTEQNGDIGSHLKKVDLIYGDFIKGFKTNELRK